MNCLKNLKTEVKFNQPLKNYTSFKIGGPAEVFIRPAGREELSLIVKSTGKLKIPLFILGAGSNILVNDKGVKGVVLKLDSGCFREFSFSGNHIRAGSGLSLAEIIHLAESKGLSGTEFLAGIPGSLGGALSMNAGAWGKNIGDLVENVTAMDYNSKIKTLGRHKLKFGYRKSSLSNYIILEAVLKLTKKDTKVIKEDLKEYLSRRRNSQGVYMPCAGCVFKNPAGDAAGRLIDQCGLKGKRIGQAIVSSQHANFILNRGRAKACEVLKLMNLIKRRVSKKFNIDLEPEIKIWE